MPHEYSKALIKVKKNLIMNGHSGVSDLVLRLDYSRPYITVIICIYIMNGLCKIHWGV